MPLKIQSSARIKSKFAHIALFGEQDVGKTMTIPTAPRPLWLLTEGTRRESLTTDNIVKVYGRPSKEEFTAWLKEEKKLKGKDLEAALSNSALETEMTGITYDVPFLELTDYDSIKEAVDFIKGPEGKNFDTVFLDSASVANRIVLDYYANQKTAKGNKPDGRMVYKKSSDEFYEWIVNLLQIPKHFVFICHGEEWMHNVGTTEEPVWQRELRPLFYGSKLKMGLHYLFSNIFQIVKGRRQPNGSMLYKDDDGVSIRTIKTQPDTPQGVERTLSNKINAQEGTNLTELFAKLTQ